MQIVNAAIHSHERVVAILEKLEVVNRQPIDPELRQQISIAERLSAQYQKPFRVIKNQRGELLVFPFATPVKDGTVVLHETEVQKC